MYHGCRSYVGGEERSTDLLGRSMLELGGDHLSFVIRSHDGILSRVSRPCASSQLADYRRGPIHVHVTARLM